MELHFHGGAKEVGRSCIELRTKGRKYLLDAGVQVGEHGGMYPTKVEDIYEVDAVFLTHGHLDHIGALPLFHHFGLNTNIFSNQITKEYSRVILNDSFKIAMLENEHVAYKKRDIAKIMSRFRNVEYNKLYTYNNHIMFKFFRAGHIPGSSSVLINTEGKNLLYTGDINTQATNLLEGADTNYGRVDVMITEATYGDRDHPDRRKEEENFLQDIKKVLKNKGRVLIASFAVGRSQELSLILNKERFDVPIYMDGMARTMTEIALDNPAMLRDVRDLQEAADNIHFITSNNQRDQVFNDSSIMISTSGMVQGGPILHYLEKILNDPKSAVFLTGYQAESTNGRMLVEEASVFLNGIRRQARCKVFQYDFSAHSGQKELHELVERVNPGLLIIQHGDPDSILKLSQWAKTKGIPTVEPENDEIVKI